MASTTASQSGEAQQWTHSGTIVLRKMIMKSILSNGMDGKNIEIYMLCYKHLAETMLISTWSAREFSMNLILWIQKALNLMTWPLC